jgi:hypothetical protein
MNPNTAKVVFVVLLLIPALIAAMLLIGSAACSVWRGVQRAIADPSKRRGLVIEAAVLLYVFVLVYTGFTGGSAPL